MNAEIREIIPTSMPDVFKVVLVTLIHKDRVASVLKQSKSGYVIIDCVEEPTR